MIVQRISPISLTKRQNKANIRTISKKFRKKNTNLKQHNQQFRIDNLR